MTRLEKELSKCRSGQKIYVNAINLSVKEIDYLRESIKTGKITVDERTLNMFVPEAREKARTGDILAPGGDYTVA